MLMMLGFFGIDFLLAKSNCLQMGLGGVPNFLKMSTPSILNYWLFWLL